MSRTLRIAVLAAALLPLLAPPSAEAQRRGKRAKRTGPVAKAPGADIPAHPNQLEFAPLDYEAPVRTKFRHELSNGVPVYVVTDNALPLVDVRVTVRGGSYLDPEDRTGLAEATADLLRDGGAGEYSAEALDEELDFLAINLGTNADDRESSASMNLLSKDLDKGLDLLFDVMRRPGFDSERFELWRKQVLQGLERRNDRTQSIERREWRRLMYGAGHYSTDVRTAPEIRAMSIDDIKAFHRRVWHPGNLMIAVSGDVDAETVLPMLEKRMEGWAKGEISPPAPAPEHDPPAGVFLVDKPDVNQSRVLLGHRSTTWDDPDAIALDIMNDILGGSGFTSRITKRVRSDEGLAYSAGSFIGFGRDYPSVFAGLFQSKNMSVAHAVAITKAEIERIRDEPVSSEELATAVNSAIDSFPSRFSSASAKAGTFIEDELYGRPADWWTTWRDKVRAVSAADVQRVAKEHLHPDELTVLVVGKLEEVLPGDPDNPEYAIQDFAGEQGLMEIALPDPLTMEYPHPPRPLAEAKVEGGMDG